MIALILLVCQVDYRCTCTAGSEKGSSHSIVFFFSETIDEATQLKFEVTKFAAKSFYIQAHFISKHSFTQFTYALPKTFMGLVYVVKHVTVRDSCNCIWGHEIVNIQENTSENEKTRGRSRERG